MAVFAPRLRAVAALALFWTLALGSTVNVDLRKPASPDYRGRDNCPTSCASTGTNPENWPVYYDLDQFQTCTRAIYAQFNVYAEVDAPGARPRVRACSSGANDFQALGPAQSSASMPSKTANVTFEIGAVGRGRINKMPLHIMAYQFKSFLASGHAPQDGATVMFAQYKNASAGIYVGKSLVPESISSSAMSHLVDNIHITTISGSAVGLQLCGSQFDGDHTFGFMASNHDGYAGIQAAMQKWINGSCTSLSGSQTFNDVVGIRSPLMASTGNSSFPTNSSSATNTSSTLFRRRYPIARLPARSQCKTMQVAAGDSCVSIAAKCGVTSQSLLAHNTKPDLCTTLAPGQHVCCSSGTLPSFAPQPAKDGSCSVHTVVADDSCARLSSTYDLTASLIETYNKKTWGWSGCENLKLGDRICLSKGSPPMPATAPNAVCGPTVSGTSSSISQQISGVLGELNTCPLNACCNAWGQCGVTAEFCTDTNTGAPGTANTGTDGCISNCDTKIVQSKATEFRNIAYFQGDNLDRGCLEMDIGLLDLSNYTHVHFASAAITADLKTVDVGSKRSSAQFSRFVSLKDTKRVLSVGGWTFSTAKKTARIFGDGVTAANRSTLAATIASFVTDHKLDGVEIDWQYPGAPGDLSMPDGNKDDGANYLAFLKVLKSKLSPHQSVSITVPASYRYLRAFPIADIGKVVDYIVFMAYDFHGQWDFGSATAQSGCPEGNCLRSHVNMTDTLASLSMVTKAGVASNKVVIGTPLFGVAYKMTDKACSSPDCTFSGSTLQSEATAGQCTGTSGFLANAEIRAILAGIGGNLGNNATVAASATRRSSGTASYSSYVDQDSQSSILVYNDDQWVSWLDADMTSQRLAKYKALQLGGVAASSIDLDDVTPLLSTKHTSASSSSSMLAGSGKAMFAQVEDDTAVNPAGNWSTLTCDNPAVDLSNGMSQGERWAELDAPDFWNYAIDHWKNVDRPNGQLSFSASMSNSAHGPDNVECGLARSTSNCILTSGCGMVTETTSNAGTYLVWNSLVMVHELYTGYYDTVHDAVGTIVDSELPSFELTFAPVPPKPTTLWVDILVAGFAMFGAISGATVFSAYFGMIAATDLELGQMAATTAAVASVVANSLAVGRATYNSHHGPWTAASQASFSALMGQVAQLWANVTEMAMADLFNGSDASIDTLSQIVSDGQLVDGDGKLNLNLGGSGSEQVQMMAKALYGYFIPSVWQAAKMAPVVVDTGLACADGPNNNIAMAYFATLDDLNKSYVCHDNLMYFLMYPHKDETVFSLKASKGLEALDGQAFGGITREDLVIGSIRTYVQNNNQNGGAVTDVDNAGSLHDLVELDITTPGYVRIPVCNLDTIYAATYDGHKDLPTYPCNLPVAPNLCGDSSFENQSTDGSPLIEDCLQLVRNINNTDGSWEKLGKSQHRVAKLGTCSFGVSGDTLGSYKIGAQDIVDLVTESIDKFSYNGKVGAKGNMKCKAVLASGQVDVSWGLY